MIEKYVYTFCQSNPPVETVELGSLVKFKTLDCFSNQIHSEEQLVDNLDYSKMNPASGPVYVKGAEPGDVLVVDIISIEVEDQGIVATFPGIGPLIDNCELRTKLVPIKEGKAVFNGLEFSVNPMIGVIGVAPQPGETVACGYPGAHGGNMDCNRIVAGVRLYFPVRAEGALLQMGDIHAVMGDGELCGTGLEVAGEITVKLDLIKGFAIDYPVLETEEKWYAIANAPEYPDALKRASETMQKLIVNAYGWDNTDAYLYLSLQGDVEICQACKPCEVDLIVRLAVPKLPGKELISGR